MRGPGATYRLQFHQGFNFDHATAILDYLHALGITDIYASPIFTAGPESTHGYDICDFSEISPALGSAAAFERFTEARRARGMGLLLDMVPNHMGAYLSNPWWRDVLKQGRASKYAAFFDIEWASPDPSLNGKVLLPVLGDRYANVLERGELLLKRDDTGPFIAYFDHRFPLSPKSEAELGRAENLDPSALHRLLEKQHYRLAFWRLGPKEINYRRFFDVTALIGLRVEDEQVFRDSHARLFELLRKGSVTALRIDHPDGLLDPKTYFDRLRQHTRPDLYIVAEKILSRGEQLPADWAVAGTTGYDFLNYLNGIFIDPAAEPEFNRAYASFGGSDSFDAVATASKKQVLDLMFRGELDRLTARLKHIAARTIQGRDFAGDELETALREMLAAFPVYRTYGRGPCFDMHAGEDCAKRGELVRPEPEPIQFALEKARASAPSLAGPLEFLASILRMDTPEETTASLLEEICQFIGRFQQLSGPATAKGLEDTAFYRFARFVSLNEVGGDPGRFGIPLHEFHDWNQRRAEHWPHSMSATATHDTKRGEDVRARLNVLSEIPNDWASAVQEWAAVNQRLKTAVNGSLAPNANDEYLLYQTLVGSWTDDSESYCERICEYLKKALREAKTNTSWTDPNEAYESAVQNFARQILASPDFLDRFIPFQKRIAFFGVFNSLAQVLLKICAPGMPDFYQGSELWDFSLVDPDNRRPVDFALRIDLLTSLQSKTDLEKLVADPSNGAIKLFTIWKALSFRREHRDLFENGTYRALIPAGSKRDHVIAFARELSGKKIIAVAPRFCSKLTAAKLIPPLASIWGETEIQLAGRFTNVLTGELLEPPFTLAKILSRFPAALLASGGA